MGDEAKGAPSVVELLTPEETAVLRKVKDRLEFDLFLAVLGKLKIAVLAAIAILTAFGVASMATIRSAIIDAAADRISSAEEVRKQVATDALVRLETVNAVVVRTESLKQRIDTEESKALATIGADLREVTAMVR